MGNANLMGDFNLIASANLKKEKENLSLIHIFMIKETRLIEH